MSCTFSWETQRVVEAVVMAADDMLFDITTLGEFWLKVLSDPEKARFGRGQLVYAIRKLGRSASTIRWAT